MRCRGQKAGVAGSSCPPLSSEECHCSFSSAYQVRIVFTTPRRAIRSSPFLACLLLTCCSHCPYLWHPFCLLLATAPTYGILCVYLMPMPIFIFFTTSAYLMLMPLLTATAVVTCCYCPKVFINFAYLFVLPLLTAPFCLYVATDPNFAIHFAYLFLLPLLMAPRLLTCCI